MLKTPTTDMVATMGCRPVSRFTLVLHLFKKKLCVGKAFPCDVLIQKVYCGPLRNGIPTLVCAGSERLHSLALSLSQKMVRTAVC